MKYTQFDVLASAFNREDGTSQSNPRIERIDISTNKLFDGCESVLDVKKAYESFWNDLNSSSEHIVFVQSIKPIK